MLPQLGTTRPPFVSKRHQHSPGSGVHRVPLDLLLLLHFKSLALSGWQAKGLRIEAGAVHPVRAISSVTTASRPWSARSMRRGTRRGGGGCRLPRALSRCAPRFSCVRRRGAMRRLPVVRRASSAVDRRTCDVHPRGSRRKRCASGSRRRIDVITGGSPAESGGDAGCGTLASTGSCKADCLNIDKLSSWPSARVKPSRA